MQKNIQLEKELLMINQSFYDLIMLLRLHHFDFCAYVVEDAYYLFMQQLENQTQKPPVT